MTNEKPFKPNLFLMQWAWKLGEYGLSVETIRSLPPRRRKHVEGVRLAPLPPLPPKPNDRYCMPLHNGRRLQRPRVSRAFAHYTRLRDIGSFPECRFGPYGLHEPYTWGKSVEEKLSAPLSPFTAAERRRLIAWYRGLKGAVSHE